ncbi:hypothetical protein Tco_0527496 [Tanacetum coccineum]
MMVFDEFLVNDMLSDERMLHKIVIVDEAYKLLSNCSHKFLGVMMPSTKPVSVLKLAIEDKVDKANMQIQSITQIPSKRPQDVSYHTKVPVVTPLAQAMDTPKVSFLLARPPYYPLNRPWIPIGDPMT